MLLVNMGTMAVVVCNAAVVAEYAYCECQAVAGVSLECVYLVSWCYSLSDVCFRYES